MMLQYKKLMKPIILIFITSQIISCQQKSIELDFTKLNFPALDSTNDIERIDTMLAEHEKTVKQSESGGIYLYTDKKKYAPGEQITLTLENKSEDITLFLYPGKNEVNRQMILFKTVNISEDSLKYKFDKILISNSPAIKGLLYYDNPGYIVLAFDAMDKYTSKKFGYDYLESTLKPGEKIVYSVTLPRRVGFYSFLTSRRTNDSGRRYWGLYNFIYSNAFEIKE